MLRITRIALGVLFLSAAAALLARAQEAPPAPAQPPTHAETNSSALADAREIIRRAAENDFENDRKARSYTYIERDETHKLHSDGATKSSESKTREILFLYGEPVARLIAKNDKPLTPEEAAKEEEKLDKLKKKREKETPEEREKRLAEEEKERAKAREFVREIADAYNFTFEPPQEIHEREMYVISAAPRPGFRAHTREGKYLPKLRFRVWIDKAECQWARLDIEAVDTVTWGIFLLRLHRGSRVYIEQTRVNDEVWLPELVRVRLDARVALLKRYNEEIEATFRDYKKFRAEVRIVPGTVAPAPQ